MINSRILRYIGYSAAAVAVVAVCSIEARAQQPQPGQYRGQVVQNRTVVNNVYNGGGYGYGGGYRGGYYNNGVGNWPGSGPYDSAIAVTAIAAGASVVNGLINSTARPQVVVQQAPVYQAPVVVAPAYQSGPSCVLAVAGTSPEGAPVYYRYCR